MFTCELYWKGVIWYRKPRVTSESETWVGLDYQNFAHPKMTVNDFADAR